MSPVFSSYNIVTAIDRKNTEWTAVLWNPLSGAMDLVDASIAEAVQRRELRALSSSQVELLVNRGYIYARKEEETARLSQLFKAYNMAYAEKAMAFVLIPTYRCNLACPYCFQSADQHAESDIMSEELVDLAFDAMAVLANEKLWGKGKTLGLFGGEPLIAERRQMGIVEYILRQAKHEGFRHIKIITNGFDIAAYFDMLSEFEVDTLQLTLDGPRPIHDARRRTRDGAGSFDRVLSAVKEALERGFTTHVRVNLDRRNISALPELVRILLNEGIGQHKGSIIAPAIVGDFGKLGTYGDVLSWSEALEGVFNAFGQLEMASKVLRLDAWPALKHIQYALRERRPYLPSFKHCDSEHHTYVLDNKGDIYTCPDISGRKEYAVGQFSPEVIRFEAKLAEWRTRSIFNIPKCSQCSYALICGGGCGLEALNRHGDLLQPLCPREEIEKMLQLAFSYYYEQLLGNPSLLAGNGGL